MSNAVPASSNDSPRTWLWHSMIEPDSSHGFGCESCCGGGATGGEFGFGETVPRVVFARFVTGEPGGGQSTPFIVCAKASPPSNATQRTTATDEERSRRNTTTTSPEEPRLDADSTSDRVRPIALKSQVIRLTCGYFSTHRKWEGRYSQFAM